MSSDHKTFVPHLCIFLQILTWFSDSFYWWGVCILWYVISCSCFAWLTHDVCVVQYTIGFFLLNVIILTMPSVCAMPLIVFPSLLRFKMSRFSLIESSLIFILTYVHFYLTSIFWSQTLITSVCIKTQISLVVPILSKGTVSSLCTHFSQFLKIMIWSVQDFSNWP